MFKKHSVVPIHNCLLISSTIMQTNSHIDNKLTKKDNTAYS